MHACPPRPKLGPVVDWQENYGTEKVHQALQFMQDKDVLIVGPLDRPGLNYNGIVQTGQRLELKVIVLNLPILKHKLENQG